MKSSTLGLTLLALAGLTLGAIALRARQRTYAAPGAAGTLPLAIEGEVAEGLVIRTFEVDGICCPSCSGKLHAALASVAGIQRVAVDPSTKRVQVLVPLEVSPERLAEALTFDDYVARVHVP